MSDPGQVEPLRPTLPSPEPRRRRWLVAAAAVPVVLALGLLAAHRPIYESILRHRAAALGFDLDFDDFEPTSYGVRLTRARVMLDGVHDVRAAAGTVELYTHWLSVESVDARNVAVTLEGNASDRVLEILAWTAEHADTYALPGTARDVHVDWRGREGGRAWLSMSGGSFTSDGRVARFQAASTTVFGAAIGAVGAGFSVDGSSLTIEAGKKGGGDALVVATVRNRGKAPEASVTLRSVELSYLGSTLGLTLPAHGAMASGRADLKLEADGVAGTASLDVDGWVPPHPSVLDGAITGKKTSVRTRIRIGSDRAGIGLDDLEVHAGRFAMKGSGKITDENNRTMVRLELSGPVACADLARKMARDELGALGALAGDVAHQLVGGSATVSVSIEANARDLGAAKITPKVGVGCELKLPGL
jgi:hypothetical protein